MFISSCGATISAVCGALALNATLTYPGAASYETINNICYAFDAQHNLLGEAKANYLMVFCGGLIILAIYGSFALIIKLTGVKTINKLFPPTIVGAVTMVIGLNLAAYIAGYTQIGKAHSDAAILIAIATMFITAIVARYGKGFISNIPFLFGIMGGYVIALITTACGYKVVNFDAFKNMS